MEKEIQDSLHRLGQIQSALGAEEEDSSQETVPDDPFDASERAILDSIREVKGLIERRDKESLVCTHRRQVIELNAAVYRKLKTIMETYNQLQVIHDKSTRSRRNKRVRERLRAHP